MSYFKILAMLLGMFIVLAIYIGIAMIINFQFAGWYVDLVTSGEQNTPTWLPILLSVTFSVLWLLIPASWYLWWIYKEANEQES